VPKKSKKVTSLSENKRTLRNNGNSLQIDMIGIVQIGPAGSIGQNYGFKIDKIKYDCFDTQAKVLVTKRYKVEHYCPEKHEWFLD